MVLHCACSSLPHHHIMWHIYSAQTPYPTPFNPPQWITLIISGEGHKLWSSWKWYISKGILRQAKVALGVPGRLRPQIFLTFSTTRVVGHQPYAPAAFTPGEIPGTHFQRLSRPQGTWFCRKEPRKKSQVTPLGIDPGTVRLAAQQKMIYKYTKYTV